MRIRRRTKPYSRRHGAIAAAAPAAPETISAPLLKRRTRYLQTILRRSHW